MILIDKSVKADNKRAFIIVKFIILIYATLNISQFVAGCLVPDFSDSFTARLKGPYAFAYWIIFLPNSFLPFALLFNRVANNKYLLLTLSFLMNLGWILELLTIAATNLNRDFVSTQQTFNSLWVIALNGIIIGCVIYMLGKIWKAKFEQI